MFKSQAIILDKRILSSTDLLLVVLTPDLGKIKLQARGARKSISKMAPFLDFFNLLEIYFAGRREIKVLTNVNLKKSFVELGQDFQKANFAYFVLEAAEKSTALEKPHKEDVFQLILSAWKKLEREGSKEKIIFLYALKLFYLLGYLKNYTIKRKELDDLAGLKLRVERIFQEVLERNLKTWENLEKLKLI